MNNTKIAKKTAKVGVQKLQETFATQPVETGAKKEPNPFLDAVNDSVAEMGKPVAAEATTSVRALSQRGPKKGSSSFTDMTVDQLIKLVGQNRHVGIPVRRVWIDRFQAVLKPAASETATIEPVVSETPIQFSVDQ